jgi:hypothetical protein
MFEPKVSYAVPDFSFLRPLKPTLVFATYWRLAAERQAIFFRRLSLSEPPWTADPVLRFHKFTNAYRAADRVSQYLIRDVIYAGTSSLRDVFFRTLLFKFFNKIETWQLLERRLGSILSSSHRLSDFDRVLSDALARGERVYSAAYIMPSGGRDSPYSRKHQMHLHLLHKMLDDGLPERISQAGSMQRAFSLLRAYPTIGDFLAYQFITDLNYSTVTDFSEMEFVVPGPGAKDGLRKCFSDFGGLTEPEVIKFVTDRQEECFAAVGVHFPTLWGRRLQLIDCQNLFCEVDKYARVAHPEFSGDSGRTRIKQKFRPFRTMLKPWFPPKWGLNERIHNTPDHVPSS